MPSLLVVDDDRAALHMFRSAFSGTDLNVITAASAREGLELVERDSPDVVVLDIVLPDDSGLNAFAGIQKQDPRIPVIFVTATGTSDTAIEAMKLGAFDYLLKPLDFLRIRDLVFRALEIRRFAYVPVRMTPWAKASSANSDAMIGSCAAMQEVYKAIGRVAPQNVTVLVRGESGTGKELVARAIYQHSPRAARRFLAVNCAAIPESLLESELFGHEKGSFTGADARRIGKFEQCNGGTLFLDEVGDMTPLMQSKILRVLQEQRFERVGGRETIETDVRIIAATNRDLEQMVADNHFRSDLYYRLNAFSLRVPPLRERNTDIVALLEHFLVCFSHELGKNVSDISSEALELLIRYPWPGNVRELQSVLKQAILQATGPVLLPDFLPTRLHARAPLRPPEPISVESPPSAAGLDAFVEERLRTATNDLYAQTLAFMERLLLTRVLRHTGGNQSRAAKMLGITRGSLRNKIHTLHITINQAVSVEPEQPYALSAP